MSIIILNGKTSRTRPNEDLLINKHDRFEPSIINGLMPTDVAINGLSRPPVLSGCVLNAPLWHPLLARSPWTSLDAIGHSLAVADAIWTPQGRKFDGIDDRIVESPGVASLDLTSLFTLEGWFKLTTNQYGIVTAKRSTLNNWPYCLFYNQTNSKLEMYSNNGSQSGVTPATTITLNQWTHYMITRNGTTINFYFNDIPDANNPQTLAAGTSAPTAIFSIGMMYNGTSWVNPLAGIVGEQCIYNRAKTLAESNWQSTKWRYR